MIQESHNLRTHLLLVTCLSVSRAARALLGIKITYISILAYKSNIRLDMKRY